MTKSLILLTVFVITTGCANIFTGRTFIDEMDRDSDGLWVAGRDFQAVAGDEGTAYRPMDEIRQRTPASHYEKAQTDLEKSIDSELRRKVAALDEQSYLRFQRDKSVLATPSEQIYYLELTDREKVEYVRLKNSGGVDQTIKPYAFLSNYKTDDNLSLKTFYQSRFEERGIAIGMNKQDVVQSWGEPHNVDFAGDPRLQNERWSFREKGKVHKVFFESGVVQGWIVD